MKPWRKELLEKVKEVDVKEDDWSYDLIQSIPSGYVQGYIQAKYDEASKHNSGEDVRSALYFSVPLETISSRYFNAGITPLSFSPSILSFLL